MNIRRRRLLAISVIAGLVLAVVVVLLGRQLLDRTLEVPMQRVTAPRGDYGSLAWLPNGWLIVRYEVSDREVQRPTRRLWRLHLDGSGLTPLPLDADPACRQTWYHGPTALPDGRLGFEKSCRGLKDESGRPLTEDTRYLMAYEVETGAVERLVAEQLTFPRRQYTWNPTLTRGLSGAGGTLCASLAWLTPTRIEYPSFVIEEDGRSWPLEDYFGDEDTCTRDGRAGSPAWSPDGQTIAFLASPQSMGVEGFARLDQPWNLYLMDPEEQQPRKVLADIKHPRGLAWSPDSQWLAFTGQRPWRGEGLWLFHPSTTTLHRIAEGEDGDLHGVAWSPDRQQLITIRDLRPYERHESELLLFDVSAIVAAP